MSDKYNPYLSPKSALVQEQDFSLIQAETIRNEHLNCEASLKSLGSWCFLYSLLFGIGSIGILFSDSVKFDPLSYTFFFCLIFCLTLFFIWLGKAFYALRPSFFYPAVIFSIWFLFGFPLGTIIGIYYLVLLFSKKGRMVYSAEYKEIIKLTPHIVYRMSIVLKVLLIAILLLFLFGALMAIWR